MKMAKTVQVTLTKNVRLHGKRYVIGSTVEVDEQVLGQLRSKVVTKANGTHLFTFQSDFSTAEKLHSMR